MPRFKGTLQPAARGDNETVKPVAPPDLWAQMDRLNAEAGIPNRDDAGISPEQYAERYHISMAGARSRLYSLVADGKLLKGKRFERGRWRVVFRPK